MPRDNYTATGRIDKRFKNFKAGFNMNFNYSNFNNIINERLTEQVNFTQSYKASLATNFRDKPNVEIGYSYNKRLYDTGDFKSYFYTDSPFVKVDAYFGEGFVFTADYSYNYYRDENVTLNEYRFLEADLSYNKESNRIVLTITKLISESNKPRKGMKSRWSVKYKRSIDCNNPKGFSQKAYCARKRRGGNYKD